jgi:hypothetical protein
MPDVASSVSLEADDDASHHRRLGAHSILPSGTWAHVHFTNVQVNRDSTTEPDLAAAKQKAQSLWEALEKYRADNGLYPTMFDQLIPTYVPSAWGLRSYRYSAHHNDWVFKSDECVARVKPLHGWILGEAKEYQEEVTAFKRECLIGYRYYQLQSRNFPHDAQIPYVDGWAYYDSSNRQWTVGWCSHSSSRGPEFAINGIWRWEDHRACDPW